VSVYAGDMAAIGERILFLGAALSDAGAIPVFQAGDFGVVAAVDGEGVLLCFLTDADGKVIWWQPESLFPEETIRLDYAPPIPRSRIPVPYGDLIGEPF
jgi:hypothetical protein